MAPEHSYIHAEDFATPADLVEYLDYLDNNDTAYLEYHAWRNEIPTFDTLMMGSTERMLCGACEEIALRKSQGFPKRMIDSVSLKIIRSLISDSQFLFILTPASNVAN